MVALSLDEVMMVLKGTKSDLDGLKNLTRFSEEENLLP